MGWKASKESRIPILHLKILHNIYPTNIPLDNGNTECGKYEYFNIHVLIELFHCKRLEDFWESMEQ